MVQRLLQKTMEEGAPEVSDAALADYYEKHRADYVRPQLFRLSHVFLAAPASDEALRTRKRAQARAVLERARALDPLDPGAFGRLAREQSEDPRTRVLDGDLRFLSGPELSVQYGPEVAAAAAALDKVGELSGVVETARGFHVLRLQGKQAPLNLALADVKQQLHGRLLYEQRLQRHERFIRELEKKYDVKVDVAALARVQVDLQSPAQEAKGPTPGFLPPPASASSLPAAPPQGLSGNSRVKAAEVVP